jgi:hypothetical protein
MTPSQISFEAHLILKNTSEELCKFQFDFNSLKSHKLEELGNSSEILFSRPFEGSVIILHLKLLSQLKVC